jgi:N-acyl homoserine lactone hydrolase
MTQSDSLQERETAQGRSDADQSQVVRLYTLDGGLTEFDDADVFSDTGEYAGQPIKLPTPSYLIQHGAQWMVWDTGNGDQLASVPGGDAVYGGRFTQPRTLKEQLAELDLQPDDISYVGISHLHRDHTGNIGLFRNATFLISAEELAWARGIPTPFGVDAPAIAPLNAARLEPLQMDRDVFGDGTVRILRAPGHTPGSTMLLLKLANSGTVLLSGDLFHTRQNYEKDLVPLVNSSRAETLASSQRFRALVANTNARVVIQHAPEDFASMPAFPKYLD